MSWVAHTGEDSLLRHANMGSTLPAIRQQELEFDKFYFVSMVSAVPTPGGRPTLPEWVGSPTSTVG